MKLKYVLTACLLFILISLVSTRLLTSDDGLWHNFDDTARLDMNSFREYFFSLFKSDQIINLDDQKRIVLNWVLLFLSEQQEQILFFPVVIFLALFVFYMVCINLLEKFGYNMEEPWIHIVAFTAAFAYLANPIAIHNFVRLCLFLSYAIFPLLFYSIIMTFNSNRMRYPVMFGFLTAVLFLLIIHNIIYIGLSFISVAIVSFYFNRNMRYAKEIAFRMLAACFVFIILTMFIMLPVFYITLNDKLPQPGYVNSEGYVSGISRDNDIFKVMTLDINLYRWKEIYYEYPSDLYYPLVAAIFSLAVVSCLLKPNKFILAILLGMIMFIFLAKAIHPPFGDFYKDLIFNLPNFGWMFRAGSKFAYMLPFFFCMALAHALASINKKKLLIAAVAAILIINGIFAWPIWTGNLANQIKKTPMDEEFIEMLSVLKEDSGYTTKVAWYSDYIESSPVRAMQPGRVDVMAMRSLIDTGESVTSLENIDEELGISYLLIDSNSRRPYTSVDYAKNALDEAEKSFEHAYDGERFDLFRINNEVDMFYTANKTALAYSGFGSLYLLFMQSYENGFAIVFADKDPDASGALAFSDAVLFGPEDICSLSPEPSKIIIFGKGPSTSSDNKWSFSRNRDTFQNNWLRVLDRKGIPSDQWLYGKYVMFSDEEYSSEIKNSTSVGEMFNGRVVEENITEHVLKRSGLMSIEEGWLAVSGHGTFENVAAIMVVVFYDENNEHLATKEIFLLSRDSEDELIEAEIKVPENASYFYVELYAAALIKGEDGRLSVDFDDIMLNTYETNYLDEDFSIPEDDDYELFVRLFRCPEGGVLSIVLDDYKPVTVQTRSDISGFTWIKIHEGSLANGQHNLRITNTDGFNAVNIAYYKNSGEDSPYDDDRLEEKEIIYVFEGEHDFEKYKTKEVSGSSYSRSKAIILPHGDSRMTTYLNIYRTGEYEIIPAGENILISIDAIPVENGKANLESGVHILEIRGNNTGLLDYLIVRSSDEAEKNKKAEIISYERTDLTSYEVTVNSSAPYFLVFTEGYTPLWRLSIDGDEIKPIPVYSLVNGFYINETGLHDLTVYYGPQPWHDVGLVISGLGYLAVLLFFINIYILRWKI